MTHQRDVIRNAVRARLIGDSTHPWGDRVWVNRPNPLSDRPHQDSNRSRLPAVLIYTRSEQAEKFNEAPREYLRTVELVVEIAVAMNDAIDDTLDDYAEVVEALILNDPYLDDTAADTLLASTDITIVGRDTERPIGAAILTFEVTYLQHFPTAAFNDTLDDLDTVHSDYSLGGEQAEADQTSDEIVVAEREGLLVEDGSSLLLENGDRMLLGGNDE